MSGKGLEIMIRQLVSKPWRNDNIESKNIILREDALLLFIEYMPFLINK